jgi:hypothetical protein
VPGQEFAHEGRDLVCLVFEREVTSIQRVVLGGRVVTQCIAAKAGPLLRMS